MASSILHRKTTYAEYRDMDAEENVWYELLNGEIVRRAAPSLLHQRVVRELTTLLNAYVREKKSGEVFCLPVDVYLDDFNVPQPDVVFVSEAKKELLVNEQYIAGAPDVVVEVISPSSLIRDRVEKMKLYARFGIPEYWLIDPNNESVEVYQLQADAYELFSYAVEKGTITSARLLEFALDIRKVFGE